MLLLVIDQISKIWIKTNMTIGESIPVLGSWFQIYFIENNGMAFGMQFGGETGKLLLTLFRLVLITFIIIYLVRITKKDAPAGVLFGVALVLVGAVGNVVDSMFYGVIFSESTFTQTAQLFPADGGYSSFMHGKVVDMLYFPIINTTLPQWVPFAGGRDFVFFRPIFNLADSCITIGVLYLLIFKRRYFA